MSAACSSTAAEGRGQRGADRARAAAEVDDDRAAPGGAALRTREGQGPLHEELGAAAGHEHPGIHRHPPPVELGPPQDVFERHPTGPAPHHGGEVGRCAGRGEEQLGLVLGEDTAGGTERGDNGGAGESRGEGRRVRRHVSLSGRRWRLPGHVCRTVTCCGRTVRR